VRLNSTMYRKSWLPTRAMILSLPQAQLMMPDGGAFTTVVYNLLDSAAGVPLQDDILCPASRL